MPLVSKWAARKARGGRISKSPGRLVFCEGSRFPGAPREVSEIESPELRLRKGLLLLITLGQSVKYDGVEVDIRIHKVVRSTFAFAGEFQVHGSGVSLIRANALRFSLFHEGKRL